MTDAVPFDAVFDSHAAGLLVVAAVGRVLRMNAAARAILGIAEPPACAMELLQSMAVEGGDGRPVPMHDTPFAHALRGEVVRNRLLRVRRTDGERRTILGSAAPVLEDGLVRAVAVGFVDVTALPAPTPTPTPTAAVRATPGTASDAIRELQRRCPGTGMEPMLRALALLARVDAGDLAPRVEVVDVRAFLVDLLHHAGRGLDLARARFAAAGCAARADPDYLHWIVLALLDNALRYSPREREVVVECGGDASRTWIAVRDHGPGIPGAELPLLFQRFQRGAAARGTEGLGLGLYIARALAEAMRGRLELAGGDRGATFRLELPTPGRAAVRRR
jgi:signal transduction histidine kinase